LLQEFLTSLNEKGDTKTSSHITEQKGNRRPTHSNSEEQETEINTKLITQSPSFSKNIQDAMMHELKTILHQIGRIHQLQTDQTQQSLRKKKAGNKSLFSL